MKIPTKSITDFALKGGGVILDGGEAEPEIPALLQPVFPPVQLWEAHGVSLPATTPKNSSFFAGADIDQGSGAAASNTVIAVLSRGLWRIHWNCTTQHSGGAASPGVTDGFNLIVNGVAAAGFGGIRRVNGATSAFINSMSGWFFINVLSDVTIQYTAGATAAGELSSIRAEIQAEKLI